jgi:hypothetical protein
MKDKNPMIILTYEEKSFKNLFTHSWLKKSTYYDKNTCPLGIEENCLNIIKTIRENPTVGDGYSGTLL